jgi:hypothetical protein
MCVLSSPCEKSLPPLHPLASPPSTQKPFTKLSPLSGDFRFSDYNRPMSPVGHCCIAMTPPNSPPPRTLLRTVTQAFQAVQAKVDFSKLAVKPGNRHAELQVTVGGKQTTYPLLGEHYILGRSSSQCDILANSPIVSQVHATLTQDVSRSGQHFVLKDRNSTNGIYRGKKRLTRAVMHHGDVYTLGPAELEDAVTLRYLNPPPWYVKTARYGLYGFTGLSLAVGAWIVGIEWPKVPLRPLPDSVQGPVMIFAEEEGEPVPLRDQPNQAHREMRSMADFSPLSAQGSCRFRRYPLLLAFRGGPDWYCQSNVD